jgi:hypothetical protein
MAVSMKYFIVVILGLGEWKRCEIYAYSDEVQAGAQLILRRKSSSLVLFIDLPLRCPRRWRGLPVWNDAAVTVPLL